MSGPGSDHAQDGTPARSQEPGTASQLATLRDEVAKLKEERDRANAGFRGFVNRIGPAVGLIVAVFAIPRGLKDSWDTILSGPETSIVPSTDVTMSYDSSARTVSFGFDLTMVNNGLKTDAIRDLTGKFELGTKKLSVPFGVESFNCHGERDQLLLPFSVERDRSRDLHCGMVAKLPEGSNDLLRRPGPRHLEVVLMSSFKGRYTAQYCFDLTDSVVAEILRAGERKFRYPQCEGRGGKDELASR